jgi:hypothetical protein
MSYRLRGTVCPVGHVCEVLVASDELAQAEGSGVGCPEDGCDQKARLASGYELEGGVQCNPWRGVKKSARFV